MRIPLSSAPDWELVERDQDIRGWRVESSSGEQLGHVSELLIDTELEHIDELILDTGTRLYPEDVTLANGVVTLLPDARVRPGAGATRGMGVSRVEERVEPDLDGAAPEAAPVPEAAPEFEMEATTPEFEVEATAPQFAQDAPAPEVEVQPEPEPEPVAILEPPPPLDLATVPGPPPPLLDQIEVEKRVIEERHNVDIPVTRDRVLVRRLVVDRPADGTEEPYWEGDEYHIPVLAERIEIRRVLRVVEELVVTRAQIQDTEHVDESVRREAITVREHRDEPGDSTAPR
jgi:uncharacterized protein (TIGR02271 family)